MVDSPRRGRSRSAGTITALCAAVILVVVVGAGGSAADAVPIVSDTFAVTGPGTNPRSVAIAASGEFFTANFGSDSVSAFSSDGTSEPTRAMSMGAGSHPVDVALDSAGTVWTANSGGHAIGSFVPGATTPTLFDLGVGFMPQALAVGPGDVIYSANGSDNSVSKIVKVGMVYMATRSFGTLATGSQPVDLVTGPTGTIYTANAGNGTVSSISSAGTVVDVFAQLPAGGHPDAIAIDSQGMLYVADTDHDSVAKIDSSKPTGSNVVATFPLGPGAKPFGLAVDPRNNVYVTNRATSAVSVIPAGASAATVIQQMPTGSGVSGIAVSPSDVLLTTSFARGLVSSLDLKTVISLASPIPDRAVGVPVTGRFSETGIDPVTYSSADLPPWLALDPATGALTGTPTAPGPVSFSVSGTSPASQSAPVVVSFTVVGVTSTATPTPTPSPTLPGPGSGGNAGGSAGIGVGNRSPASTLAHTGAESSSVWVAVAAGALLSVAGVLVMLTVFLRRRRAV